MVQETAALSGDRTGQRLVSTQTVQHDYLTLGGRVARETITTDGTVTAVLDFIYDSQGRPFALNCSTDGGVSFNTYYYVLSLQGDVVMLVEVLADANGIWSYLEVASYTYDAWGNIINSSATTSLICRNPLRYRGYIYDTETGFYYLQSRYYDPANHRFINADGFASTGQGFVGTNMFAYCLNNPVMRFDPSGTFSITDIINRVVDKISKNKAKLKERIADLSKRDYNDFLDDLGMRESSDNYGAVNQYGYMGRYQMGSYALQDAGFQDSSGEWTDTAHSYGVYSNADFLSSPEAQDAAIEACHVKVCGYIRYYGLDQYIGSQYCGVTVTQSGLLAACHLVGVGALFAALPNGEPVYDGNGTPASEYMDLFGGYDVSKVWC